MTSHLQLFRQLFRLLVLSAAVLIAAPSAVLAVTLPFTGTLRLEFGPSGATLFDQTVSGAGSADVTYAGGDVDAISGLTAGAFTFAGPTFPVTDPALVPVVSIRLDATNGAGSFSGLTTGGGGTMGVLGQFTAEIFAPGTFLYLLTDDGLGQGIGLGGSFLAEPPPVSGLIFFLSAAPWTTGMATNSYGTRSGFSSGNTVRLVSPFTYDATGAPIVPSEGFAVLELTFVPEPGTLALVGCGLAAIGARRRSIV